MEIFGFQRPVLIEAIFSANAKSPQPTWVFETEPALAPPLLVVFGRSSNNGLKKLID